MRPSHPLLRVVPRMAGALALLSLTACFSVPAYVTPEGVKVSSGADLGAAQKGRWACPGYDLVLLADGHLRELNNDYDIAKSEVADGGRVFRYRIGQVDFGCFVPDDPKLPARVSSGGFVPTSTLAISAGSLARSTTRRSDVSATTTCAPQPAVELL